MPAAPRASRASITALPLGPEPGGIPEVPSGSKQDVSSPPLQTSARLRAEEVWPRHKGFRSSGEAAQTITEECERLFCDTLSALFRGEGNRRQRKSLAMGAFRRNNNNNNHLGPDQERADISHDNGGHDIDVWFELWDYANDAIYRGFATEARGERALFVFFDEHTSNHGVKNGLLALFELADMEPFRCSQVVACVPRSADPLGRGIVRNLGWCGFSLTTLEPWMTPGDRGPTISEDWLFMVADV